MQITASVIIPNWNGRDVLPACLESLSGQSRRDFEIIVVDNGSDDDSVSYIRDNYPGVRIVSMGRNSGFAAAVNKGIEYSKGKYVALLNNDTMADSQWLEELCMALRDPGISFCSCKILNFCNREYICELGQLYCTDGSIIQIGAGLRDTGRLDRFIKEIFGPTGAAAIYRRKLFDQVGGFDEDFFLYYEDVDFNFRCQLRGFACHYVPTSVVYHLGGYTTRRMTGIQKYFVMNKLRVLMKNLPSELILKYSKRIHDGLENDHLFLKEVGEEEIFFQGFSLFFQDLERILGKRHEIMATRKLTNEALDKILVEREDCKSLTIQEHILSTLSK